MRQDGTDELKHSVEAASRLIGPRASIGREDSPVVPIALDITQIHFKHILIGKATLVFDYIIGTASNRKMER
ncbi:hypothetical protein EYF80_030213 [Liparis tanakae]|uniref:Uncharacterized protein n=1 Tax=Liparis tanakae TaxID=230148 RepID=A0A4Z2H3A2_9TELE|nr:hypothetical protein EYF80_030213 [Liparis tanakae]